MDQEKIKRDAEEYARTHKKEIAERRADRTQFPPDKIPVSVFMAGSPGAGKTEASQNLVSLIGGHSILRIDADEIRSEFPGYDGSNSSLFQGATSIIADRMQDLALQHKQSFVFDGTLTNLARARSNIQRSIDHGRKAYIVYVYQDPRQAWTFVKAREKKDGRAIPQEVFIEQYFQARANVNTLKQEFRKEVVILLVVKNIDGTDFAYFENIDVIDKYIPERFNKESLKHQLDTYGGLH